MEVHEKIAEIAEFVGSARTMPMSSSAMVNKSELLAMLDDVRALLPDNLSAADAVLEQREALLDEARGNADRLVAQARSEQAMLVADHTVVVEARAERDRMLELAAEQAAGIKRDVDDYVDAKLAHLELAAQRIVDTVRDGREQLRGHRPFESVTAADPVRPVTRDDDEDPFR